MSTLSAKLSIDIDYSALSRYEKMQVQRVGSIGDAGGLGSELNFVYGPDASSEVKFTFNTLSVGNDNTLYENDGPYNVKPGGYASFTPVQKNGNGVLQQTIIGYFPCPAPK